MAFAAGFIFGQALNPISSCRQKLNAEALLAIFKGEERAEQWMDLLVRPAAQGELRICDIVAAEVGGYFSKRSDFERQLTRLGVVLDPFTLEACHHAGSMFQRYRKNGGAREHLIPDFLAADHAYLQADALAADDRGYLRGYFRDLRVVNPESVL